MTSVGRAGFITSLYVVMVPLIGMLAGKKPGGRLWAGVALAVGGLYCISSAENGGLNQGDFLMLGSALAYALQILAVERCAALCDSAALCAVGFCFSG